MAPNDENTKGGFVFDPDEGNGHSQDQISWFFGIGINEYKDDHFKNLNNPVKDVKDLARLLQEKYDVTESTTITLFDSDATRSNILEQLERLKEIFDLEDDKDFENLNRPKNKLLIYFSGHGELDKDKNGFWVPYDAKVGQTHSYIRNSTIRDLIKDFDTFHILIISDSCFSGSLLFKAPDKSRSEIVAKKLEKRISRWVLSSGREDEKVLDGLPGENSPYCKQLLNILDNDEPLLRVKDLSYEILERVGSNESYLPDGAPMDKVRHLGGEYVFRKKGISTSQGKSEDGSNGKKPDNGDTPGNEPATEKKWNNKLIATWEKLKANKINIFMGFASVLFIAGVLAVNWYFGQRVPYEENGLYGFKLTKKSKDWKIYPQFDTATEFNKKGNAEVTRTLGEKKEDYTIDKEGECVSRCPDLFRYKEGSLYGVKNKNSSKVTQPQFHDVGFFGGGFISVMRDRKWGFVNKNGDLIIPMIYDKVDTENGFQNGRSLVELNGEQFYIDESGVRMELDSIGQ